MTSKNQTYNHGVEWEEGNGVSQAYAVNGTVYISGQLSHDMEGRFVGEGDIEAQVRQTLDNLDRVLAGMKLARRNLAYIEIFMTQPHEHATQTATLLKAYMGDHRPAATLVGVTALAFPAQLVEIAAIAHADA